MLRTSWLVVTALAVAGLASAQTPPAALPPAPPAGNDLPVNLDRIRKGLEKQPAATLVPSGHRDIPRFYLEIVGTPDFQAFLKDFDLVYGPTPWSSMTHQEFMNMVTPKELYSQAGFGAAEVLQAAVMAKGLEWLVRKSAGRTAEVRHQNDLNAVHDEIKLGLAALVASRAAQGGADGRTLDALSWLTGCWESGGGDQVIEEQWMAPRGGTLLGMSRTVAGPVTIEHEFLQIRRQDDGVFYVASPSGKAEASFKLISDEANLSAEAIFENASFDFPRRISYRLQPDGSMLARVEGVVGTSPRTLDFTMKRVVCR